MTIASIDDIIKGMVDYGGNIPFYYFHDTATTATLYTNNFNGMRMIEAQPLVPVLPALPGGKTYYAPTEFVVKSSNALVFSLVRLTSFGSIDISGASGTFSDGSAAPTITEGGVSRQIPSGILAVVTVALNATPGTLTVTYTDQDGNTAAGPSHTLTASAAVNTAAYLRLNAGDWGAVDITAASRGGGTTPTGTIKFYHVWPISRIGGPYSGGMAAENFMTDTVKLMKLAASDNLAIISHGTAACAFIGDLKLAAY